MPIQEATQEAAVEAPASAIVISTTETETRTTILSIQTVTANQMGKTATVVVVKMATAIAAEAVVFMATAEMATPTNPISISHHPKFSQYRETGRGPFHKGHPSSNSSSNTNICSDA